MLRMYFNFTHTLPVTINMEASVIFLVTTKTLVDLVACGIFALFLGNDRRS